jgi:hypothetical protein
MLFLRVFLASGLSAVLLLSGCALLQGSTPSGTFLQPSQQHFQFTAGFNEPQIKAVAYNDPSEYEEYVRAKGDEGARGEAILSVATGSRTVLEFSKYKLHSLTRSWTFNQTGTDLLWDQRQNVRFGKRTLDYAFYRRRNAGQQRSCMAFVRAWDRPPNDSRKRVSKAFFGYYCAPNGQQLTKKQAITVLRGIKTRTDDVPRVYFGQHIAHDPGALVAARGKAGTGFGNPQFPFQFSRYYQPSAGQSRFR